VKTRDVVERPLRELARVDQPLVLITQAQRSGGTLLQRLLDGHPQCHVVPFQFRGLDEAIKNGLSDPQQAWNALYDPKLLDRFRHGHRQRKHQVLRDGEVYPFTLPPDLQRTIYDECAARLDEPGTRGLIECYLTAFFNAWLDYRNLQGSKRWLVAFEPAVASGGARRSRLRRVYPDGRIVSILRDPWSWYASASRWEPRWRDREEALDHWCRVADGTRSWKRAVGADFRLIRFEDLLLHTEEIMRKLAAWLEIEFVPGLLEPTFNGQPIIGNTGFGDVSTGVSARPLERAREELDAADVAYIKRRARHLYKRLLRCVDPV
jgi:sulfotransferase family protein